jgi:hypothetical protein
MSSPESQEQEEQMADAVYRDQALRDRVRARIPPWTRLCC